MGEEDRELLLDFKEEIEGVNIQSYGLEEAYVKIANTITDYMNTAQDFDFESLTENFIDYELLEDYAKRELEDGGLERLYYFLPEDFSEINNYFYMNAYANVENITTNHLETLKEETLDLINDKLGEE